MLVVVVVVVVVVLVMVMVLVFASCWNVWGITSLFGKRKIDPMADT